MLWQLMQRMKRIDLRRLLQKSLGKHWKRLSITTRFWSRMLNRLNLVVCLYPTIILPLRVRARLVMKELGRKVAMEGITTIRNAVRELLGQKMSIGYSFSGWKNMGKETGEAYPGTSW
ncbi:unnamed protein product [Linum tenue]|uniref:Uncharacterized protein n=1 Tax=Linum tenue TaxID=586396 RepID=A0AAV0K3X8_9ROSI|nr:unnamed protein product [Linum tenue]